MSMIRGGTLVSSGNEMSARQRDALAALVRIMWKCHFGVSESPDRLYVDTWGQIDAFEVGTSRLKHP